MKWEKAPEQLIERFYSLVPKGSGVENRKMFGYPCSFVRGNMFMGVHQKDMFLRLSEKDRKELLRIDEARQFEPIAGRVMKEYVVVPPHIVEDNDAVQPWIQKSLEYARGLPPKKK